MGGQFAKVEVGTEMGQLGFCSYPPKGQNYMTVEGVGMKDITTQWKFKVNGTDW